MQTPLPQSPASIKSAKEKELLEIKRKLWYDVYVAYVYAANATDMDSGYKWAAIAIKRFDEMFNQEEK